MYLNDFCLCFTTVVCRAAIIFSILRFYFIFILLLLFKIFLSKKYFSNIWKKTYIYIYSVAKWPFKHRQTLAFHVFSFNIAIFFYSRFPVFTVPFQDLLWIYNCQILQPRAIRYFKVDSSSKWMTSVEMWTLPTTTEGKERMTDNTNLASRGKSCTLYFLRIQAACFIKISATCSHTLSLCAQKIKTKRKL